MYNLMKKKKCNNIFKSCTIKRNFGNQKDKMFCTFLLQNDNKLVNLEQPQVMKCLLCYNATKNISNSRTNTRKGLISYCKTNGIMS